MKDDGKDFEKMRRMVKGAVADVMKHHPEYFTRKGRRAARESIVKRVVGTVFGELRRRAAEGERSLAVRPD